MKRFGIDELEEVLAGMDEFFVAHGIEDTFNLRVDNDDVAQKVRTCFDSIPEELQKQINDVPEEIREELQDAVDLYDIPTFDSFQSKFRHELKADVFISLQSLIVNAEKLGLERGYDELVKITMNDVVIGLTSDQNIDKQLEITKRNVIIDILKGSTEDLIDKKFKELLGGIPMPFGFGSPMRFGGGIPMPFGFGSPMRFGGGIPMPFGFGGPMTIGLGVPAPSDTEDSDDGIAGFQSLLDDFGICDDIDDVDDPTDEEAEGEEDEEDEEEDPEFGGDVDLPGI